MRLDDELMTRDRVLDFLRDPWNYDTEEEHQEWMTDGDPIKIADWLSMNWEIGRRAEDEDE